MLGEFAGNITAIWCFIDLETKPRIARLDNDVLNNEILVISEFRFSWNLVRLNDFGFVDFKISGLGSFLGSGSFCRRRF